jgi:N utilization substance protein B
LTRRNAREYVLQVLFQYEFTGKIPDKDEMVAELTQKGASAEIISFVENLTYGTIKNVKEIDDTIQTASRHWEFDRIAVIDRNIMRFAVYELIYRDDIPSAVTINEAIDIAKKFSTVESYSFINGILDKIAHDTHNKP